jgi:hypothetical protein
MHVEGRPGGWGWGALALVIGALVAVGCGDDDGSPPPVADAAVDGGSEVDGAVADGGLPVDGSVAVDGGLPVDGSVAVDGGLPVDGSVAVDGGLPVDGSVAVDGGACDPSDVDGDGVSACAGDCDDATASVYPGATESCNGGIDDDCDGRVDADDGACVPCGPGFEGFDGACTACGPGYEGVDGVCRDVDECAASPSPCGEGATGCVNAAGTYACTCAAGFDAASGATCLWSDAHLVGLGVSSGVLTQPFGRDRLAYDWFTFAKVPVTLSLTPTLAYPARGSVTVDGAVIASGAASAPRLVSAGDTLTVEVRAESGATRVYTVRVLAVPAPIYFKASNTGLIDRFGSAIAVSADGTTLAVGAPVEDSASVGVNGDEANDARIAAGAVYVFRRSSAGWAQEAYVKASITGAGYEFGAALALSADGTTLAVGARLEASAATGIGGDPTSVAADGAGAVYVFRRGAMGWAQEAYVKASNTDANDRFGGALALSADGATLAVGAEREASSVSGVGGDETNNTLSASGAVYVFRRGGAGWAQEAYVKASNPGAFDAFGVALALSGDGLTLAVGAIFESSAATGIGGDETSNALRNAGAVYVLRRSALGWAQEAYVKASNTGDSDRFGAALALSSEGATLAVGASYEASCARGVGGDQANDGCFGAGAVYVLQRGPAGWAHTAYVKADNAASDDRFGSAVALSADGTVLAVGAPFEDSPSPGRGADGTRDGSPDSGAGYVFRNVAGAWVQETYLKSPSPRFYDGFGTCVALSGDGTTSFVGVPLEDSGATGVGGDFTRFDLSDAGAVFAY